MPFSIKYTTQTEILKASTTCQNLMSLNISESNPKPMKDCSHYVMLLASSKARQKSLLFLDFKIKFSLGLFPGTPFSYTPNPLFRNHSIVSWRNIKALSLGNFKNLPYPFLAWLICFKMMSCLLKTVLYEHCQPVVILSQIAIVWVFSCIFLFLQCMRGVARMSATTSFCMGLNQNHFQVLPVT